MKSENLLCSPQYCTGCGACMQICKHHAITMKLDILGFKHPKVNQELCTNCGLCSKKCPSLNPIPIVYPQCAIACHTIDKTERENSSSGALATILAKHIISKGGIVYGCAYLPPMEVRHIRCKNVSDIQRIKGSKYIQSNLVPIYDLLKQDLSNGICVLFIGTPCQVAAIKALFGKYDTLYTLDIICHGISSLSIFKSTLPSIPNENIANITFRKNNKYHLSITSSDGKLLYERPIDDDMYMKGYFNGTIFRHSCYICQYAQRKRCSDITAGDFWGLKSNTIREADKGVSLALINTPKGQRLFNGCTKEMYVEERPLNEAFAKNEQLNHPFHKNFRSDIFRYLYPKLGYNKALWCALPEKVLAMKLKNMLHKMQHHED